MDSHAAARACASTTDTPFNADAVIWNLERFFNNQSPQFEAAGSAITRARVPVMESYRKRGRPHVADPHQLASPPTSPTWPSTS
jgi:hypothetical protein